LLFGLEYYYIRFKSCIEVASLFVAPGALLLGIIGLFDPRVPGSLQPNACGYPKMARLVAMGCWAIGAFIGAVLNGTVVSAMSFGLRRKGRGRRCE
jgi:hypothetical protein